MIGESLTRSEHGLAAAEWHKKEAAIYRAQGLRAKEAVAKDSLASALEEGGKPHEEVLAVYRKALALAQEAGSCETQSAILENIYLTMGELKKPTAAQRRERETVLARLLSLRDEDSELTTTMPARVTAGLLLWTYPRYRQPRIPSNH